MVYKVLVSFCSWEANKNPHHSLLLFMLVLCACINKWVGMWLQPTHTSAWLHLYTMSACKRAHYFTTEEWLGSSIKQASKSHLRLSLHGVGEEGWESTLAKPLICDCSRHSPNQSIHKWYKLSTYFHDTTHENVHLIKALQLVLDNYQHLLKADIHKYKQSSVQHSTGSLSYPDILTQPLDWVKYSTP